MGFETLNGLRIIVEGLNFHEMNIHNQVFDKFHRFLHQTLKVMVYGFLHIFINHAIFKSLDVDRA